MIFLRSTLQGRFKPFYLTAFVCAVGFAAELSSKPAEIQASAKRNALAGEFLVKVSSRTSFIDFAQEQNLLVVPQPLLKTSSGDWYKVIDSEGEFDLENFLERGLESGILHAEPNLTWRSLAREVLPGDETDKMGPSPETPTRLPKRPRADPLMSKVWGLGRVAAPTAWNKAVGSERVVVADIDTGVDYNHEDLINNIWRNPGEVPADGKDNDGNGFVDDVVGWDFSNKDNRPWDDNDHGSHTAGTMGATGGNGRGISGVSKRLSIMPLKFLSRYGSGSTEDAIRSINYAVAAGAQILSNSWGGDEYSQALEEAILAAAEKNVLFVAAAGNDFSDNDITPMYPASYQLANIISVAASNSSEQLAEFSNFGSKSVHLAAPGDVIYSTLSSNKYGVMSGTSMACPMVAGAAALLKAYKPDLTATQIKALLMESVDKSPAYDGKVMSGGRLNVARALGLVAGF